MHELAVDAHAEQLRVARFEFPLELAKGCNLGGTHEGEVLRPEEHDLPLAGEAVAREGLEAVRQVAGDDAREGEFRKTLTNA